jgi:AbrB family looped-hinge helix DNA binding protein
MSVATIKLSTKGQIVIPKEIRDELAWQAGTELTLVTSSSGLMLKAAPTKTVRKLEDLIGMLKHNGKPIPIEELCKPVDIARRGL